MFRTRVNKGAVSLSLQSIFHLAHLRRGFVTKVVRMAVSQTGLKGQESGELRKPVINYRTTQPGEGEVEALLVQHAAHEGAKAHNFPTPFFTVGQTPLTVKF